MLGGDGAALGAIVVLVRRVVRETGSSFAAGAPLAIQYTKAAVNKLVKEALNISFDFAIGHELVTFMSEDHKEALAALRDKRPPRFEGR